ncbi:MAG: AAC(3) family N-acetyltransferase [Methylocystaceae bacterium]|nr:AAC(3) family N-acetyltransferase [Methylocystaceae bacterium]
MMIDKLNDDCALEVEKLVKEVLPFFKERANGVFWLSLDFRTMLLTLKVPAKQAEEFTDYFMKQLLIAVGPQATILVPAFNLEFPSSKEFDVTTSGTMTGAFGGLLVKRYPVKRLAHPFYSFLAFGEKAPEFLRKKFPHSTGPGSVFEWIMDHETQLIVIGHHYVKSLTNVHHAEDLAGVKYRYRKPFKGTVIDAEGRAMQTTCSFFVRELETCDFSSVTERGDRILRQKDIVRALYVSQFDRHFIIYTLNLTELHDLFMKDLEQVEPELIDYFGPQRENVDVITAKVADQLYSRELGYFKNQLSA